MLNVLNAIFSPSGKRGPPSPGGWHWKSFRPAPGLKSATALTAAPVLPGPALTGKSFSGTLSHSCKPRAVALPETDTIKTYPRHDDGERLPRQLIVTRGRIEPRLFKRAFLQTLLVKKEAVGIPAQKFYALPVLGEEHEDVSGHWGQGRFALYQIEQRVDALPHVDRLLAHEVPAIGI